MSKPIILTGDRPTGRLHLGHYVGSLRQRVLAQDNYEQFVLIADMQALTDNATDPKKVSSNVLEVMADYLAVGLDPAKTTFCLQSALPALSELTCLYLNLVTVSRLERNPTLKAEIRQKGFERSLPAGFLTYPVSQAADITAFGATHVPVGEDQLPMLEQCNEIVRKLNGIAGQVVLKECQPILSETGRLPGIDGKAKMSKSLGNTIDLAMSAEEVRKAVFSMYTDPNHLRVEDPGQIEGNCVFSYLDAFHSDKGFVADLKVQYLRGGLGDVTCKRLLNEALQLILHPIRERRYVALSDREYLMSLLKEGTEKANQLTQRTLMSVKSALSIHIM